MFKHARIRLLPDFASSQQFRALQEINMMHVIKESRPLFMIAIILLACGWSAAVQAQRQRGIVQSGNVPIAGSTVTLFSAWLTRRNMDEQVFNRVLDSLWK